MRILLYLYGGLGMRILPYLFSLLILLAANPAYSNGFVPSGTLYIPAFGGVPTSDIDLDGTYKLILDADADSYWFADVDDTAKLFIGGAQNYTFGSTGVIFLDDINLILGTGSDGSLGYNTTQTEDALVLGLGTDSRGLVIAEQADIATDFGHAQETDPTIFLHSADATDTTQYGKMQHDQTDFVIDTGAGDIKLDDDVYLTGNKLIFNGGRNDYIQSTADDYITFYFDSTEKFIFRKVEMRLKDDLPLNLGTSGDASLRWNSLQTPDTFMIGLGSQSNGLILNEKDDFATDYAHALQTNPTLYIQSADQTDIADWISLTHDQTDGVIDVGNGDIKLDDDVHITGDLVVDGELTGHHESGHFSLATGAAGTRYIGGYYNAPAADANLTQASPTQTLGTANVAYGAHAFVVAAAAGAKDAGTCDLVISGTSLTDAGVRTPADSETIVTDVTTESTDEYSETTKKWIGQITYTLTLGGGATTCNYDFNYGFAKYYDHQNTDFTMTSLNCQGEAGANDSGFDIELLYHSDAGWTYSAAAFVPGASPLAQMTATYVTEVDLANGIPFAYKKTGLSQAVIGSTDEGYLIRVTTGAANALDILDCSVDVELD